MVARPERVEASLWRRFSSSQDGLLRESLFDRYRRFASAMARRHSRRLGVAPDVVEDIEQFAFHGLLEAIDRYDPLRGATFLTFATARIAGNIFDGMGRLSEFGAHRRFQRRRNERVAALHAESETTRPALDQLGDLVTELALGLMLEMEDRHGHSEFAGRPDNAFDTLAWTQARVLLRKRVDELPEPERSVIRQHYQNDMLFAQIALMLGLTRGRVSQLHKSALTKLRKTMRAVR